MLAALIAACCVGTHVGLAAELGGAASPFDLGSWAVETDQAGIRVYRCDEPRCSPPSTASVKVVRVEDSAKLCALDLEAYSRSGDGSLIRRSYFEMLDGTRAELTVPMRTEVYDFQRLQGGDSCGLVVLLRYAGDPAFYRIRILYRDGERYSVDGAAMTPDRAQQIELALSRRLGLIP